ncbi:unnamed protein product, partial [Ixodes hexagonus]
QFSQLYSIHGFLRGEGLPLVVALMPDKTRASYTKLFEVVRSALCARCGDVGQIEVGHFDFEMVAISTFEATFPTATSKGCLFHLAQCVNRKMTQLGLRLVSLALLPVPLVRCHWFASLKGLMPLIGDPRLDSAIAEFAVYFEQQWPSSERHIVLWNHNAHQDDIRTTNHVVGTAP